MSFSSYAQKTKEINIYWENGKLKEHGHLLKKKKHGEYNYYNELEILVKTENYKKGELIDILKYNPEAFIFDSNGNLIEVRRYNTEGYLHEQSIIPDLGPSDKVVIKYQYDQRGNIIEERYFDSRLKLVEDNYDPAIVIYKYNSDGSILRESYLDKDGNPMEDVLNFSFKTYEYNNEGLLVKTEYRNKKGELVDSNYGSSTVLRKYDKNNQLIELRLLAPDGELAPFYDLGPPIRKYSYKEGRIHTLYEYLSETKLYGLNRSIYNTKGQLTRVEFYAADDTLKMSGYSYRNYDDNGNNIASGYINEKGDTTHRTFNKRNVQLMSTDWGWISKPELSKNKDLDGKISFKVILNSDGTVKKYMVSSYSASPEMFDYCKNVLNNSKFKKLNNTSNFELDILFEFKNL